MRHPAGEVRLELRPQRRIDVEKRAARPAAQPLQHAADGDGHVPLLQLHRRDAGGLEDVEHQRGADLAAAARDGLDVDHERRLEEDVRQRHDLRPLVDGLEQLLEIESESRRIVRDGDDFRAEALRQAVVDVADRRELAVDDDHAIARRRVLKRREHHRLGRGHVRQHDHRAARRADQRRDNIAHFNRHQPPLVAPRAHAARGPQVRVLVQRFPGGLGHRAEGVGDEVLRAAQDGEAVAEAEQHVILSGAKDLRLLSRRSFAASAAQDDGITHAFTA